MKIRQSINQLIDLQLKLFPNNLWFSAFPVLRHAGQMSRQTDRHSGIYWFSTSALFSPIQNLCTSLRGTQHSRRHHLMWISHGAANYVNVGANTGLAYLISTLIWTKTTHFFLNCWNTFQCCFSVRWCCFCMIVPQRDSVIRWHWSSRASVTEANNSTVD